jgi:NCAIR mutase (PurE)-related protein
MKILNHDASRDNRCGVPEVVYGAGKSAEDLA